ncbi:MAG: hypothetical protein R2750_10840 [Bacteroidales bacterium]
MKTLLIIFTIVFPIGLVAQKAYIQVEAKPGISVYVDNVFQGKTSLVNDGILIIDNVIPGVRTIKLIDEGYSPQEERINVKPGEVYTYKVRPFFPIIKISESGNTGQQEIEFKVGTLKIQSLPVSITIEIPTLGVNYTKSKDEWMAEEIPEGIYPVTFILNDKSLNDTIEISPGKTTHLMVDMVKLEVGHQLFDDGEDVFQEGNSNYSTTGTVSGQRVILPEYGIILGESTVDEITDLTYSCTKAKNKCHTFCEVENFRFWDQHCDSIIDIVHISRSDEMTSLWQENMGFSWNISYTEWIVLLEKLGYTVNILERPYIKKYKGVKSLRARIEALSENTKIIFFFAFGEDGISVNSKKTLDSVIISLEKY